MEKKEPMTKCAMVINSELPLGLIANTATVLSLTLGKKIEDIIGPNVFDVSGRCHVRITTIPIPILKSNDRKIKELRDKVASDDLEYLGIAIYGDRKKINKLTGNLSLLR